MAPVARVPAVGAGWEGVVGAGREVVAMASAARGPVEGVVMARARVGRYPPLIAIAVVAGWGEAAMAPVGRVPAVGGVGAGWGEVAMAPVAQVPAVGVVGAG